MVVAFFSDGPLAAVAALLARRGLVAMGGDPIAIALPARQVSGTEVEAVLASIADRGRRDVVLTLPKGLLSEDRLAGSIDVAVDVSEEGAMGTGPKGAPSAGRAATNRSGRTWRLNYAGSGDTSEQRSGGRRFGCAGPGRRTLPLQLPTVHGTRAAFARNGIECAPPVREALLLVALLLALAADPDASDPESALLDLLSGEASEGFDRDVDRVRDIADRLDAMPPRGTPSLGRERAFRSRAPVPGISPCTSRNRTSRVSEIGCDRVSRRRI